MQSTQCRRLIRRAECQVRTESLGIKVLTYQLELDRHNSKVDDLDSRPNHEVRL